MPRYTRHGSRGEGITLSDVIRGLQFCVNSSQDIVEQHHISTLARFLDDNNYPITKTIKFGSAAIDVPLLCLNNHSSLIIDELNVKFNLMLRNTALKTSDAGAAAEQPQQTDQSDRASGKRLPISTRTSFGVNLANVQSPDRRYANIEIGMKFKTSAPPEMFSRIIDSLNNTTNVYPAEDTNEETS